MYGQYIIWLRKRSKRKYKYNKRYNEKERKNNIKNELLYASVWLKKMWFFPLLMSAC